MRICVGNEASYAAGFLVDKWIELPLAEEDLNDRLAEIRQTAQAASGELAEEMYVSDYEDLPFGFKANKYSVFNEYADISMLNLLAQVVDDMTQWEYDAVEAWSDVDTPGDIAGLINVCLQAEDIPYDYTAPRDGDMSNEEKLGETMLNLDSELRRQLDELDMTRFVDLKAYGEECANYYHLTDSGYLDQSGEWPDKNLYTEEELREKIILPLSESQAEAAAAKVVQVHQAAESTLERHDLVGPDEQLNQGLSR